MAPPHASAGLVGRPYPVTPKGSRKHGPSSRAAHHWLKAAASSGRRPFVSLAPGDLVPRSAGPFNYPSEMVADPAGDLYVSDGYRNARVHRFAPDGHLKRSWG